MKRSAILWAALALLTLSLVPSAWAEDPPPTPYSGDLLTRSTLTGDWADTRNKLAEKGITFDANVTQIEQGVTTGGKSGVWAYGGRGNLTGNLDTQKLGLWPGGFLTVELEGNWASSVDARTGTLIPPNTNALFPVPGGSNVALPNLSYTQFLSHYVGATAGKVETMTADPNEFAHGKGDKQFFNLAFNINPVVSAVPYSTLAAGAIVLPTADPNQALLTFLVLSATGKATTAGFDDINGAVFAGSGRVRTELLGLTGHQSLGAFYSNKDYTSIDQRLGFVIRNRAIVKKDGTWALFYNFDQFLYETDKNAGRGVGLFGRFGASAGNPIPVQYFYSIGIGGKGLALSRPYDQFGIGYFYSSVRNPTLQLPFSTLFFLRDEWGVEMYYNFALTQWLLLTPDFQVIGPSQRELLTTRQGPLGLPVRGDHLGTETVLGFRLEVVL